MPRKKPENEEKVARYACPLRYGKPGNQIPEYMTFWFTQRVLLLWKPIKKDSVEKNYQQNRIVEAFNEVL